MSSSLPLPHLGTSARQKQPRSRRSGRDRSAHWPAVAITASVLGLSCGTPIICRVEMPRHWERCHDSFKLVVHRVGLLRHRGGDTPCLAEKYGSWCLEELWERCSVFYLASLLSS